MNNEGELKLYARISNEKLGGDINSVKQQIEQQLKQFPGTSGGQASKSVGRGGVTNASANFLSKLTPAARERVLRDNPWMAGGGSGGSGGGGVTNASAAFSGGFGGGGKEDKTAFKMQKDRAAFIKDATFAMMPLFNPTSVWGNLFASRQIFSAFAGTKTGGNIMGKVGLSGVGGAALASGGTIGVLLAVGLAIKALTKTMHEMLKAYQNAGAGYAKSLTTGLGIGFVTKRTMLAQIMGVSELDVVKFGKAMQYLNPQIEWASGILSKTNANLTSVGWSFSVLGNNLKAMFATMANDAAPAIRKFVDGLSGLVKETTAFYDNHKEGVVAKGLKGVGKGILFELGLYNPRASFGIDRGPAPAAQSWMKQLPASTWEHMGLVVGGGGTSPAQQTARATREAANTLKDIRAMVARSNNYNNMRGVFGVAQSYQ